MPRNAGSVVDVRTATVRDRNGQTYSLDALEVADGSLYYARPIEGNEIFWYQERWLLPAHGLLVNRFAFHAQRADVMDWYIETDAVEVAGDEWRVRDCYLDIIVHDGVRYELEDAGELAEGIERGEITLDEGMAALRALDALCSELRANGCSGAALLAKYAPSLPATRLRRGADGEYLQPK